MEDSLEILSTMSPKIQNKARKVHNKTPTKLALKRNIRRSYFLDRSAAKEIPVLVETASTDSSSCNSQRTSTSSDPIEKLRVTYVSSCEVNKTKRESIKRWLNEVNVNRNVDIRREVVTVFEELKTAEDNFSCPTPRSQSAKLRFDEFVKNCTRRTIDASNVGGEMDNNANEKDSIEDSFDAEHYEVDNNINDDISENVLDQLYGDKWRGNKEFVLTPIRPKLVTKPIYPQTDIKLKPKSKLKQLPHFEASPWRHKLNGLCDSETDDSFNENLSLRLSLSNQPFTPHKEDRADELNESDKENFSDFLEEISLSLEDRIRKKLSVNKNTPSKSLHINNEPKEIEAINSIVFDRYKDWDKKSISDYLEESLSLEDRIKKKFIEKDTPKKTINGDGLKNKIVINKRTDNTPHKLQSKIPTSTKKLDVLSNLKRKTADEPKVCSFLESLSGNVPLTNCDASARIFRTSFKEYKNQLVDKLYKLFNGKVFNNVLPQDLPVEWNERMTGTAGTCSCKKITRRNGAIERNVKIQLSTKVLDCASRVRDTFIHELCHAATWIVNEVADGHGRYWKAWANKAMTAFPELPPIKRCHEYVINKKYTYRCTGCGYSFGRHTKSINIEKKRCGYCFGKMEIIMNKVGTKGEVKSVPVTPKRPATGFALFVKENYGTYKSPQLTHAQVMKTLSSKYNEMKESLNKV